MIILFDSSSMLCLCNAAAYEEDENKKDNIRNRSMGSIETDFTSVTQLKWAKYIERMGGRMGETEE
jgi:hypothetical protein